MVRLRASFGRYAGLRDLFAGEVARLVGRRFGATHDARRERAWRRREALLPGGPAGDRGQERAEFDAGDPWRRWWEAHLREARPAPFFAARFWEDAAAEEARALAQERRAARERLLQAARAVLCTIDTACCLRPRCGRATASEYVVTPWQVQVEPPPILCPKP